MNSGGECIVAVLNSCSLTVAFFCPPGSGGFYRHFKNKEDVLRAAVEAEIERVREHYRALASDREPDDPAQAVGHRVEVMLEMLWQMRDLMAVVAHDNDRFPDLLPTVGAVMAECGVAIDADITFHALLAQAAGNRVLAAAIDLIRRDRQATLQLDAILKYTDHKWVVGHERILRAVKRGAPAAAERAMLEHIDALIADVRSYRDRVVADVAVPAEPTSDGLPNRPETVDG